MAAVSADRSRTSVRTAVVWEYLRAALAAASREGSPLHVLDVGGGSGGFAVPLAEVGHLVTVVDPSPDSLAALERRAAETGTSDRIRALQGEAAGLGDLVAAASFDAALCHSVLEVVDDPNDALRAIAGAVRAGGIVSVLAANRVAAVVARASAGRLGEARRLLASPTGSAGEGDPLARRFTLEQMQTVVTEAGLRVRTVHGVRVFADVVPAALLDTDPQAVEDLLALEHAAAEQVDYLAVATKLHVLADRD